LAVVSPYVSTHPDDAKGWVLMARAHLGLEDLNAALNAARRASAADPESASGHQLASLVLSRQQDHLPALREAQEAARLAPNWWGSMNRLAMAHVMAPWTTDFTEAREAAARAIELAPMEPHAHVTAGSVELAAANLRGAKAAFERALELDPQDAVAHHELARLQLRSSGGLARAATGFATAIRAAPGDSSSKVSRRNLDLVVRIFLGRAAYLLFIASFFAAGGFGQTATTTSRLVPLAILLVPFGFVAWFVARLTPDLRRYLLRALTAPPLRVAAVASELAAVGCIVAASVVPQSARAAVGGAAFGLALVGRFCLMYAQRHPQR
jgi:tetratricopeptide (TPR) repeat protein